MSVEKSFRDMLIDGIHSVSGFSSLPSSRITFGLSPESAAFPNVTFEIVSKERITIGPKSTSPYPMYQMEVEILSCEVNAASVTTLYEAVETALDNGVATWDDYDFLVIHNEESIIDSPSYGSGDEAEPFVARTKATVVYRKSAPN